MNQPIKQRSLDPHQAGQALPEYALVIVLVLVVVIVVISIFGSSLAKSFQSVINALDGGQSTQQIISDMNSRIISFYNSHGNWPRTFSPFNFTDIGLTPNDWSQPINGLYFSPHGSEVGIANRSGDTIEVYAKDLNGNTVHLINGWSIWCPANNANCYYHTVAPGNEVVPGSIYATGF